jgi:hypothetical protein
MHSNNKYDVLLAENDEIEETKMGTTQGAHYNVDSVVGALGGCETGVPFGTDTHRLSHSHMQSEGKEEIKMGTTQGAHVDSFTGALGGCAETEVLLGTSTHRLSHPHMHSNNNSSSSSSSTSGSSSTTTTTTQTVTTTSSTTSTSTYVHMPDRVRSRSHAEIFRH